jgi:DNA-directed RNA polymerase specialized sigma24 family protein
VFPTTVWELVADAGARDPAALEDFARAYRGPVLEYLAASGAPPQEREDLCQEVFVRLLKGGVLAKADAAKGTFRSLLKTVTYRIFLDWRRRGRREWTGDVPEQAAPEPDFDRLWAVHLTERALAALEEESPSYHEALSRHVAGEEVHRNKVWIARGKLAALIRREIALTCRGPEEIEEEWRSLAPFLGPREKD